MNDQHIACLSDADIIKALESGSILISDLDLNNPRDRARIQPASVDIRIGDLGTPDGASIPSTTHRYFEQGREVVEDGWWLRPGVLYLGVSKEYFELSPHHKMQLHGKSSIGRLGVSIHVTAGLIDPGFKGDIVFEIVNLMTNNSYSGLEVWMGRDQCVGHLEVQYLKNPAAIPYGGGRGSHYQGQRGLRPSRLWNTHVRPA